MSRASHPYSHLGLAALFVLLAACSSPDNSKVTDDLTHSEDAGALDTGVPSDDVVDGGSKDAASDAGASSNPDAANPGPDAGVLPVEGDYFFESPEVFHRIDDLRITQALDMIVHDGDVVACFGSWHSAGNDYDSHCRNLSTGEEERGSGRHETVGVGLAVGEPGVLIGFEANDARTHGGPGAFGDGVIHDDGGTHFWQSVSVGHGFAIAAAARIDGFDADVFIGETEGAGPWSLLETSGKGVPHRQTFVDPYHLIFTTRYQGSGSPRIIRVDAQRNVSTVTYTGLPGSCEGVSTAELVPNVGLVAGSYADQLPWRGGDTCAQIGLLDPETGETSNWLDLGGADVADIIPIGDQGHFAVTVNFPARVVLVDPDFNVTDTLDLTGNHVGGLAYVDGQLYAGSARPGDGAWVYRVPLRFEETSSTPTPLPNAERSFNVIFQQTVQACDSCGIWFDWQGQQANKPRLEVDFTVNGQPQTVSYQHGDPSNGDALAVTIDPNRSTVTHEMLVKRSRSSRGLFQADISDIPDGAQVNRATLHLHINTAEGLANSDRGSVLEVRENTTKWNGDGVTWTESAAGTSWGSNGGDAGPVIRQIRAKEDLHDQGYNKAQPNARLDFTNFVQELLSR